MAKATDKLRHLQSQVHLLAGETSRVPVRLADGGTSSKKYELGRTTRITGGDPILQVVKLSTSVTQLPTGAKVPDPGSDFFAYDRWNIQPTVGTEVVIVYDEHGYDDSGTHNTYGKLPWTVLPFGGTDTTKTLLFKLYNAPKARNDTSFQAHLCTAGKTIVGSPVTIYDPFGGTDKGFSSGHHDNAIGRCTLERDADTGAVRLVVTHLESVAQFVVATLAEDFGYTVAGQATSTSFAPWGLDLHYLAPTSTIELIGNAAAHGHLKSGAVVTGVLLNPDASPTEYVIIEGPPPAGEAMLAKITGTVSAKAGDTYGTGTADIGHPVDGAFAMVEENVEVLNPSNLPINLPSGVSIHIPVLKINGVWVLSGALELLSLAGYMAGSDQTVGKDADGLPEFQNDGDCDEEEE